MITVVTRWETDQMPPQIEWQMWRQLRGAFSIKRIIFIPVIEEMEAYHVEQCSSIEEALEKLGDTQKVFLEPTGYKGMHDLPQGDCALIIGNTANSNIGYANVNETYMIKAPHTGAHLYGVNAAAIALAFRYGQ